MLSPEPVSASQQQAARIAGVSCLISFPVVVWANLGVFGHLIVRGNAVQTGQNILAHERLFRLAIVGNLTYCVGTIVLLAALYIIQRPVNGNLALLAALGRLVLAFTWIVVTLNLFTALRLLRDVSYAGALGQQQLSVLVRLYLNGFDAYYVGLLFWSLGATVGAYLWLRSRFIPRLFALFGLLASAWCALCTLAFYVSPAFAKVVNLWWFDSPMAVFELALSALLIVRGLATPGAILSASSND